MAIMKKDQQVLDGGGGPSAFMISQYAKKK
jgi:hypothetical protein